MNQPRRFYYAVDMSDGDTLFFEGAGIDRKEAERLANEDTQKQIKGARAIRVERREVTAERRWS